MKRSTNLTVGSALAGALVLGACGPDADEPTPSAQTVPAGHVIALTSVSSNDAVASALTRRFGVVDGHALSKEVTLEALPKAKAVLIDMSLTTPEDAEVVRSVVDVATAHGVPVVLEHTDVEQMTDAVGFGLPAEAVVVEVADGGFGYHLRFFGESGRSALEVEGDLEPPTPGAQVPDLPAAGPDGLQVADAVVHRLESGGAKVR